jgi:putative SOS response-associated peptidase YedK
MMPGRVIQDVDAPDALLAPFGAEIDGAFSNAWKPRYNVSPGQTVALLRRHGEKVRAAWMKWGIAPKWMLARGSKETVKIARCEAIATKPSFKDAFRNRRCILPITGWYEWPVVGGTKQPTCVRRVSAEPLGLAAIFEEDPESDGLTFAVVTCEPNELVRTLHHRMGVFIEPADAGVWLDPASELDKVEALLRQAPNEWFRHYRVSTRVNSVKNDDPNCAAPETSLFE